MKIKFNHIKEQKKFIAYFFLRVCSMGLGLISNVLIIRKLTVDEFGVFSIALLVVNLLTTLGFNWSSSSILYFGSKEKEIYGSLNKTFWSRNIIILVSILIITIGIFLFREQVNRYIGINIWFLLILWLYVSVIEDYLYQYFLSIKKQITSSMLSITAKIIYILLIIIFPFDVKELIILYIISHSSVIFFILAINRNDIRKFEFDKTWFKTVLNFSLWQLFGFSGLYLINFGDIAVVKHFMTSREVGIYNAAYQLFIAVASFSSVISSYFASSISASFTTNNKKNIRRFYYKERWIITTVSILMHILIILLSKPVIILLYGEEYLSSVTLFNILMLGSIIKYLTVFYMLYYNTNGKYAIQQIINIIVAISNIILSIVLIQVLGLIGPAVGTVIAYFFSLLFSYFYCEKRIKDYIKEVMSN